MKICYVGRFDQPNSNDDEGAVLHSLRELGHEATPVREEMAARWLPKMRSDLLLFNKWDAAETLNRCRERFGKVAFWYWDLVDWPTDPTLAARCWQRREWMARTLPLVDLGFCSDGDWVLKTNLKRGLQILDEIGDSPTDAPEHSNKLHWLPQGADERVLGRGDPRCPTCGHADSGQPPILFCGIGRGGGQRRESFVRELRERWGDKFRHVESGVHGKALADMVAQSKVVVAPDSPVTDRYGSNRVYLMLGFGAFLLHPRCAWAVEQFGDSVAWYDSREHLHHKLGVCLEDAAERATMSEAALGWVKVAHLYRHRVERLLAVVEGKP